LVHLFSFCGDAQSSNYVLFEGVHVKSCVEVNVNFRWLRL